MALIGYHASHEQYPPGQLLQYVQRAEAAGFGAAMCSDHFHPWTEQQGQSGFAWSWLGAALAATRLSFGVVNAPGYRYHPAIIAQAAATLCDMFPDRFWLALGSGEQLNEAIIGMRWPSKPERNERLRECVDIMRALWRGEEVTHRGHVVVEGARLYSLPPATPLVVGAAITPGTARWVGSWADALITTTQPRDALVRVIDAFRSGGGAGKPLFLQVQLSYAATDHAARASARAQWGPLMLASSVLTELRSPAQFEAAGSSVRIEDMEGRIVMSADLQRHTDSLHEYVEMGFARLYLHNVNRDQERFIDDFGGEVLPALAR